MPENKTGKIKYRGETFDGYNKPKIDTKTKAVGVVLVKRGDKVKLVRFGDDSYTQNDSAEKNDAFYARFGNNPKIKDPFSPLYWSAKVLWPRGDMKGKGTLLKATNVIDNHDYVEQVAIEVVYEPYKLDAHNQWMSPETIRKGCESFNLALEKGIVKPNLFHIMPTDLVTIEKSWINEVDCVIGDKIVPEGTWLVKMKYHSTELWNMLVDGELQGVSIGAMGKINKPNSNKEALDG